MLSSHILSELQDICDGAVIIEQGKVLSAGTLEEILRGTTHSADDAADNGKTAEPDGVPVVVKLAGRIDEARLKLLEQPGVHAVERFTETELHAIIAAEQVNSAIAALLTAQLPVTGFSQNEIGLEELFMKITAGNVR